MSSSKIASLKLWQLKTWALLTGIGSSGTKTEMQALLLNDMNHSQPPSRSRKIVSVDMGIRNLAYCVIQTPPPTRRANDKSSMKVTAWRRMDLLSTNANSEPIPSSTPTEPSTKPLALPKTKSKSKPLPPKSSFIPSSLSKTSFHLITTLLTHTPTEILIERQRFRSGGASAIQEWTVRVNMLESMLWASLETLRYVHNEKNAGEESEGFPETIAINPRRVAEFWVSGREWGPIRPFPELFSADAVDPSLANKTTATSTRRPKIEKKDKVEIVRSWVSGTSDDVKLEFEGEAAEIAEAFRLEKGRGAREIAGGKLDDLADCLLQGVAHVRWGENREVIRGMLKKEVGEAK